MKQNWRHGDFNDRQKAPEVEVDADKVYDLPELIDIAERANPETRIAWERARQAAAAVGLSQSAYFPYLVASAGAGYERAFLPFPTLKQGPGPTDVTITGGGTLTTEAAAENATLGVKWLLFDFGERKAVIDHGEGKPDDGECRIQCRPSTDCFHSHAALLRIEYRAAKSRGG